MLDQVGSAGVLRSVGWPAFSSDAEPAASQWCRDPSQPQYIALRSPVQVTGRLQQGPSQPPRHRHRRPGSSTPVYPTAAYGQPHIVKSNISPALLKHCFGTSLQSYSRSPTPTYPANTRPSPPSVQHSAPGPLPAPSPLHAGAFTRIGRHNPKTRICAKCFAFAFP